MGHVRGRSGAWVDPWLDLLQGGSCAGCERPGRSLCDSCRAGLPTAARVVVPDPCPPGLVTCVAAGEYAGVLRSLVLALKEEAVLDVGPPLADCLALAVTRLLQPGVPCLLVPVPSSGRVVRGRGHDPVGRLARAAARRVRTRRTPVGVLPLLAQCGAVADQAGLDRAARAENRRGTLVVRPGVRRRLTAAGAVTVVVVDDVLTTGATVREAQRALEVAGVGVRAVATVAATRRRHPSATREVSSPFPPVGPDH